MNKFPSAKTTAFISNRKSIGVFNPDDYLPRRFALNFSPKMIVIEYTRPSNGKLYQKRFKINQDDKKRDPEKVCKIIKKKYPQYFGSSKISDAQLLRLISKLLTDVKSSVIKGELGKQKEITKFETKKEICGKKEKCENLIEERSCLNKKESESVFNTCTNKKIHFEAEKLKNKSKENEKLGTDIKNEKKIENQSPIKCDQTKDKNISENEESIEEDFIEDFEEEDFEEIEIEDEGSPVKIQENKESKQLKFLGFKNEETSKNDVYNDKCDENIKTSQKLEINKMKVEKIELFEANKKDLAADESKDWDELELDDDF